MTPAPSNPILVKPDQLQETNQALLNAAAEEFAEKGFQAARIREIARRAGANVAAVNYHFGSKEKLYLAVLEKGAFERLNSFPIVQDIDNASGFESRFRESVLNILKRFMSRRPASVLPRIMIRELSQPTAAIQMLIRRVAAPQLEQVSLLVKERVGPRIPPDRIKLTAFSIVGQCLFYLAARPLVQVLAPEQYEDATLEQLASHIATFSLGGLDAIRKEFDQESI